MNDIIEQFPQTIQVKEDYKSFIYQPERVSLNSRQFLSITPITDDDFESDYYYQFRCDLKTPLLRVKSLELLRASIPNIVPSIPNDECFFFYYRVPVGGMFQPDYASFTSANIFCVYLFPSDFYLTPNQYPNPNNYGFNTVFEDYDSLVIALNKATTENSLRLGARFNAGDISFSYSPEFNKIVMTGNDAFDGGGNIQYYYAPVGYNDPNLLPVIQELKANFAGAPFQIPIQINEDGYTLNRRLGFTFNGIFTNPPTNPQQQSIIDKRLVPSVLAPTNNNYIAENYADLVNTGNIFLYADIAGGSTQDTNSEDRLLAVIPANSSSLAVAYGESKIPCELTKTSENIYSINFTMRTDKGIPYTIPTNAYVNLELKLTYR